jgi:flagellar export protein FliJ
MSIPLRSVIKIHSLKETMVTQAEWELADAVRNEQAAEVLLRQMEQKLEQSAKLLKERQQKGVSAREMLEWTDWIEMQRRSIEDHSAHVRQLSQISARCKDNLVEKHMEKETWQRLKRQRLQVLEFDMRKQEQSELDEMAVRRLMGREL